MELRFIDSIKFMSSSLDSLVNNLARGGHEFWGFENYNCPQRELLSRKGIYPYEYMDSWDKFKETSLPRIEKFYSNLNMSGVSDGDYEHACRVWQEFGIRNMGEYHDLYLRTDVVLLANVFESFRRVCLENYGLDPSHFYTSHFWVEFDESKDLKMILDELSKRKDHRYLLEVDVAYPTELHDYQNDLPFMCAKMKLNGVEKLVPNLYYKRKYAIHIKALKQAIDHGLVLEKIHRI